MEGSTKLMPCESMVGCLSSLNSHQNLIVLLMSKLTSQSLNFDRDGAGRELREGELGGIVSTEGHLRDHTETYCKKEDS